VAPCERITHDEISLGSRMVSGSVAENTQRAVSAFSHSTSVPYVVTKSAGLHVR